MKLPKKKKKNDVIDDNNNNRHDENKIDHSNQDRSTTNNDTVNYEIIVTVRNGTTYYTRREVPTTVVKNDRIDDEDVNAITSDDKEITKSKAIMQRMLSYGLSVADLKIEIQKQLDSANAILAADGTMTDYRKVLGDNPDDIKDTKYGNNNVIGPDKEEALHVHT